MKLPLLIICLSLQACMPANVFNAKALNTFQHSEAVIQATDVSIDGKFTIVAEANSICLWINSTNTLRHPCITSAANNFIEIVGLSKNNNYYFTSNKVALRLYAVQDNKLYGEWQMGDNIINDIAMSANAETILLGFRSGKASILQPLKNSLQTFPIHRLDINSVSLSEDGKFAFTGSSDKKAILWQSSTGKVIQTFKHRSRVNHLNISGDGKIAFTIDAINDRKFWDLSKGSEISELATNIKFIEFNDSSFSSDNKWLLTGSPGRKVQLWQTADGALIAQWEIKQMRQRASVLAVSFQEDDKVISESSDGVLEVWPLP